MSHSEKSAHEFKVIINKVTSFLQIDGILYFEDRDVLPQWDKQIESVCCQLNNVIDMVRSNQPEWYLKSSQENMVQ